MSVQDAPTPVKIGIGKKADGIMVSDAAAAKVAQLVAAEGDTSLALRVAVRPGGCSGFSYEMFFDSDVAGDDQLATYGQVKVIVDPASAQLLTGATLDYADGLQDAGFKINNPNASRTCGCGNSFS
jgi:iron-sulfur cluster assembly accessory protein